MSVYKELLVSQVERQELPALLRFYLLIKIFLGLFIYLFFCILKFPDDFIILKPVCTCPENMKIYIKHLT